MYEGWPFFRKLVDFMQMTLAKSDLRIAENYTSLVSDPAIRERLWQRISGEHASCVEAPLRVTGNDNLLADSPVLQRSIRLRNPYVDPLSYIQVTLLLRLPREGERAERPAALYLGRILRDAQTTGRSSLCVRVKPISSRPALSSEDLPPGHKEPPVGRQGVSVGHASYEIYGLRYGVGIAVRPLLLVLEVVLE